jgi:uncharacterized protein (TIGR02996 family)
MAQTRKTTSKKAAPKKAAAKKAPAKKAPAKKAPAKKAPAKPPAASAASALEALRAAAAEPAQALAHLDAAWRAKRAPEIAAVARRAGALAGEGRPTITGVDPLDVHASWLAVDAARDPADVDRLLAALTHKQCDQAIERLERMAAWEPDPRTQAAFVAMVTKVPTNQPGDDLPFTSQPNRRFWIALWPLLDRVADPSIGPALRTVLGRKTQRNFDDWLKGRIEKTLERLDATPPPELDDAERAALAAVEARVGKAEAAGAGDDATREALFAAVWADPQADQPRMVLADWLTEQGDPRGEFIALQLARAAGKLDKAGKEREKELLKRHKKEWLGPIAPLIQPHNMRFERGFLATCNIEPNAEREKTLGKHPAWSTIRQFHAHDPTGAKSKPLIRHLESLGAVRTWPLNVGIP